MNDKYRRALVIGKFQPLHKGHMALIEFAKSLADRVDMLVTAHAGEQIPLDLRRKWAQETYVDDDRVAVYGYLYDPMELNESSESDLDSSREWADYLMKIHPGMKDVDVIVGSERYVQYMADYLGISYAVYDQMRERLKVSATMIKSDPVRYWDYLAPAVKRYYVSHVCICGSESTGKSTTCRKLEEQYGHVTMIPEIGRCLVGKSELCSVEVLHEIYDIHHRLLKAVYHDPPTPIVIWDTDNITTLSYCTYLFGDLPEELTDVVKADKYFFFASNIEFHDDGTRFSEDQARLLSDHHLRTYASFGIFPEIVNDEDRYGIVEDYITTKINQLGNAMCKA